MGIKVANPDGSLRDLGERQKRLTREKSHTKRTGRWKTLRLIILARDPICKICNNAGAVEVDHIKPLHLGGDDSHTNLQGLCKECHKKKSADEHSTHQHHAKPSSRRDSIIP